MKLTKNIKSSAIKLLQTKANAVQNLGNYINVEFESLEDVVLIPTKAASPNINRNFGTIAYLFKSEFNPIGYSTDYLKTANT